MVERSIFTHREAEFLQALVDHQVEFMVVGLSAALLQGAPAITQDIDLWIKDLEDPGFRRALKKVGAAYVPQIGLNPPRLAGESVNLFDLVVFDRIIWQTSAKSRNEGLFLHLFIHRVVDSRTREFIQARPPTILDADQGHSPVGAAN